MDQNNPLLNNTDYSQSPTNVIQMEQSDYSGYFSTTGDNVTSESYATNNYEQQQSEQSAISIVNNEDSTSTTQPLYYAPQYTVSSPPAMVANPFQTNNSEMFTFEVPGYKIIIIPTAANNLDMQNQDYAYLNPFSYTSVNQSQLNQEQSYVSSVNGPSSDGSSAQQQNFLGLNESFSNFSNLRD